MSPVALVALVAAAAGVYASAIPQGGRRWWAFAACMVCLVITSQLVSDAWRTWVLDAAELSAVGLVWTQGSSATKLAARHFLLAVLAGTVFIGIADALPTGTASKLILALTVLGFALKLGLVPFAFWLPRVAACAPAMTSVLIIGLLDIAVFMELVSRRATEPWLFDQYTVPWVAVGLVACLGGAVLALAQSRLTVLLAYSSIQDLGELIVALVAVGVVGIPTLWLALVSHALCKLVLFGSVGVAEHGLGRTVSVDTRGLLARFPVAGAAFIAAALGFVGVPPMLGFIGHWQVYLSTEQFGGAPLLAVLIAASVLELLYYVRAIHSVWLGPVDAGLAARPAVRLASSVTLVVAVATVLLGMFPSVLEPTTGGAPLVALRGWLP